MIPDAEGPVSEVGDDESEGADGDVEVRENGDNLVVRHSVESFTEIYCCTNNSSWIYGGIVKVSEDEVNHSYDIVHN